MSDCYIRALTALLGNTLFISKYLRASRNAILEYMNYIIVEAILLTIGVIKINNLISS